MKTPTREVRYLFEHSRDQVDAFQQLEVDVHVVRHVATLLHLLLVGGTLMLPLRQQTLSQQLLGLAAALNINEAVVGVEGVALAEGAQSELHHAPVVADLERIGAKTINSIHKERDLKQCETGKTHLGGNVCVDDRVLQVGHEHEVTRFKPLVVERQVVYMEQYSLGADTVGFVIDVDVSAQAVHHINACIRGVLVRCFVKLQYTKSCTVSGGLSARHKRSSAAAAMN